ncbi:MAG: ATP-binding cassette domain-containing protein, partial [Desulfobacterales bacterium]|nr:ATP-binding cassette domain-containing protein [Desulfobacterales bacterium]
MILYLRSCLKYFLFAGLFSLFINTLHLTFPLYMLAVYVRVFEAYRFSTLYALTGLALAGLLVMGILELFRSRLLVLAGIKIDKLLSRPGLKKMLQDLCRTDSIRYTQGLKDINTLRNYLGGNSVFAFFDVPWVIIYLWVIYLVHPVLGAVATGGAVVIFIIGLLQNRLAKTDTDRVELIRKKSKTWRMTSIRTAQELHAMGMAESAADGFCKINDKEMVFQGRIRKISHFLGAVSQSFGILMQVIIFGTGAILVLRNEADPGVIIAASIIMGRALAPINQGIGAWKQTSNAKTAYNNLKRLLEISKNRKKLKPDTVQGRLKIENLTMEINGTTVLSGIDFELAPGEIMGLIGPNGAGKTSLCRMMLGMWEPTNGAVRLDGLDVYEMDTEFLGRYLGFLPQNVELFTGTIKENIARMGETDSER